LVEREEKSSFGKKKGLALRSGGVGGKSPINDYRRKRKVLAAVTKKASKK